MALGLAEPGLAADAPLRTARGRVLAVETSAVPPVIVITAETSRRQELVIGATVDAQTVIRRGDRAAALADLQPGEVVTLRYIRNEDGLRARFIEAK